MGLDATKGSNLYESFCCLWGDFMTGETRNMNLRTVCTLKELNQCFINASF